MARIADLADELVSQRAEDRIGSGQVLVEEVSRGHRPRGAPGTGGRRQRSLITADRLSRRRGGRRALTLMARPGHRHRRRGS